MAKVVDGAVGIGFVERVLPVAAEEIPVLRIARFEMRGGFVTCVRAESCFISGTGVANAKEREGSRERERENEDGEARREVREAQKHSKVLCLHCIEDARRKAICRWRR